MSKFCVKMVLALLPMSLLACGSDEDPALADPLVGLSHQAFVASFIENVLRPGDPTDAARYVAEDYIQHSPGADDGLDEFISALTGAAGQFSGYTPHRYIAEGDFVVVHSEVVFDGQPLAVVDIFRLAGDGAERRIVEHWDTLQPVPESQLPEDNSMFTGPTPDEGIARADTVEFARSVVASFDTVFNQKDYDAAAAYFDSGYINHNPFSPYGIQPFLQAVQSFADTLPDYRWTVKRVIAQGDFVVVHAHHTDDAEQCGNDSVGRFAAIDIFRVDPSTGLIAEHWDVGQSIPETIVGRSMFDGAGLYNGEYGPVMPCP